MKRLFIAACLACSLVFAGLAASAYAYTASEALAPLTKLVAALTAKP